MEIFLAETAKRFPDDYILMVADKAAWHTAKSLAIPENIELFPLPSHSPELNPTEHIWDETREKGFKNEIFNSLSAVEDRLCDTLRDLELNSDRVKSMTAWDWIICINLTAN
jgi:transposase